MSPRAPAEEGSWGDEGSEVRGFSEQDPLQWPPVLGKVTMASQSFGFLICECVTEIAVPVLMGQN